MSSSQATRLLRASPHFPVSDVKRSMNFYDQVLGFRCEYSAGVPLQFAICSRDDLAIMLRRVEAAIIVPNEKQGGTWDAFFWVNDADGCTRNSARKAQTSHMVH